MMEASLNKTELKAIIKVLVENNGGNIQFNNEYLKYVNKHFDIKLKRNKIGTIVLSTVCKELKPCPFCGREVEPVPEGDYWEVTCEHCQLSMWGSNRKEIGELWNKRI